MNDQHWQRDLDESSKRRWPSVLGGLAFAVAVVLTLAHATGFWRIV